MKSLEFFESLGFDARMAQAFQQLKLEYYQHRRQKNRDGMSSTVQSSGSQTLDHGCNTTELGELGLARVSSEQRGRLELWKVEPDNDAASDLTDPKHPPRMSVVWGRVSGRLQHRARSRLDLPAVGDFVAFRGQGDQVMVEAILERRSQFVRQAAGEKTQPQVVAANVDTVLVVTSANRDFNVRRIERYLAAIWDAGATPVVLLSKTDLCDDIAAYERQIGVAAPGTQVLSISALEGAGMADLQRFLMASKTYAIVGSSGVGKSTLVNALLGDAVQDVKSIRDDDARGRHTTTARQMFRLKSGALIIDTPGMRELQLWGDNKGAGAATVFEEIALFAEQCRFRDCSHQREAGCAIQRALKTGDLKQARWLSYDKLVREKAYQERKKNAFAAREEARKWKQVTVRMRRATRTNQKLHRD